MMNWAKQAKINKTERDNLLKPAHKIKRPNMPKSIVPGD